MSGFLKLCLAITTVTSRSIISTEIKAIPPRYCRSPPFENLLGSKCNFLATDCLSKEAKLIMPETVSNRTLTLAGAWQFVSYKIRSSKSKVAQQINIEEITFFARICNKIVATRIPGPNWPTELEIAVKAAFVCAFENCWGT